MAMATKGAMEMVTRVVGNKEGDGDDDGKVMGNGRGDEGGKHATATRAMATVTTAMWAMAEVMRVAGNIDGKGKGGKGNGDGDKSGGQQKG